MMTTIRRLTVGFGLFVLAGFYVERVQSQDINLNSNYGAVTLKAGFLPDPYTKALVAGGPMQVNIAGVPQHITKTPDFKLHYKAGNFPLIIHVQSKSDTTLLINLPDGSWVANDDGPNNGLNPLIRFAKPMSGWYTIWVGTFGKDTANATLFITELEKAGAIPPPIPPPPQPPQPKPQPQQPQPNATPAQQAVIQAFNQARDFEKQNRFAEAAAIYERLIPAAATAYGADSVQMGTILNNLGFMYAQLRQYHRALPLYERSLAIRDARLGGAHPDVSQSIRNIAQAYLALAADPNGSLRPGQHLALNPVPQPPVPQPMPTGPHADLLKQFNDAQQLQNQARYLEALAIYEKILPAAHAFYGKDAVETTNVMLPLAYMYFQTNQYAKAETLFFQVLQLRENKLGKDHPDVTHPLIGLTAFYSGMGQYEKAETFAQRSIGIMERKHGKDDVNVTYSLNSLASLYLERGQPAEAEPVLLRSIRIMEAALGKNNLLLAYPVGLLARSYQLTGQYAKAEPLALESLKIQETVRGKNHPEVAHALFGLADLYRNMRQYAKAEALYKRTLQLESTANKNLLFEALTLHKLAMTMACQKLWREAIQYSQPAHMSSVDSMAKLLPQMSEKEQLSWIDTTFEKPFHEALSLAFAAPHEATVATAEWLLNGKASGFQGMAEQHLLARDARDPNAKQLVDALQQTRALLAALINQAPAPGTEAAMQQKLLELKNTEQDLAQKLARAVGRAHRVNSWMTIAELRAKLRPQSVYVDIARFDLHDFDQDKKRGPRYGAWITPPQGAGDIKLVDLGDAEVIDRLVEQTRKSLIDSAKSINMVGEAEAAKSLDVPLRALSAKVLHPLLPSIAKYEEWIVCPDGALWLMPWNALPLPQGEYAVEKHLIRHVVSGRDLVQEFPKAKSNSAYVFADPNYDLSPTKVMAAVNGLRGGGVSLLGQRLRGTIGSWNVSFEFQDKQVVIRDEDSMGLVAGTGSWTQRGDNLVIETTISTFDGKIAGDGIRGQKTTRNNDGTSSTKDFRIAFNGSGLALGSARASLGLLRRVSPLPGTALEAEEIRPKLEQWLGQAPKVFLEEKASETLVKSIRNPRVLVLATHGYFLPRLESTAKGGSALDIGKPARELLDAKGQPIESPLLRCGLMLAGCNKRTEAKAGEDDGILTGIEIVGMNLQGCELVVLSACETGLGDVRVGDGVAGLRQAFQLAGTKGVLASLWQVPDRETARLMNAFYGELTKGRSQAEALRQAQLSRITARRQQFGAAHPFNWSAFTLTSRGTE